MIALHLRKGGDSRKRALICYVDNLITIFQAKWNKKCRISNIPLRLRAPQKSKSARLAFAIHGSRPAIIRGIWFLQRRSSLRAVAVFQRVWPPISLLRRNRKQPHLVRRDGCHEETPNCMEALVGGYRKGRSRNKKIISSL